MTGPRFEPFPVQAPAEAGVLDVAGGRIRYWTAGPPGGEPVVLCHPASQCAAIWLYQQPVLAGAGYRAIGWSRRGHGGSEQLPDGDPGTQTGDLRAMLDRLGVRRAHVVGAAAGGITATGMAVAHPERVASLVLAGTIVSPDEEEWRQMYARLGIADLRGAVSATFLELGPSYRAASPEGTARFTALEHAATSGPRLRQPLGVHVDWSALEALRCPTLFITGEADLYAPPPLARLLVSHMRAARLETMRETGHAPYWEAPAAFNGMLLAFLDQHRFN